MQNLQTPNIYIRSVSNFFRHAPIRVGVVLPGFILPYLRATAVARLRVYDVIEMFVGSSDFLVELYVPWRHYDVVLFEKSFTFSALALARKLKSRGVKIILDVNVDYFSGITPRVTDRVRSIAHDFSLVTDAIIAPSLSLVSFMREAKIHNKIEYIPEFLPDRYFSQDEKIFSSVPKLVWCGYREKAYELMAVKKQLEYAMHKYGASLLLISDANPKVAIDSYEFIEYRERTIVSDILRADVFIAPRYLDLAYKNHHTFTKIGLPMSIGLPVIASPVPSYLESPAIICNDHDWGFVFDRLYSGDFDFSELARLGQEYCAREFSWERGRRYYSELFHSILS